MATKGTAARMDFTPIDYDVTEIEPDAPEGEYKAVSTTKLSKTNKDAYPMIIIEWKIKDAADKANKTAAGATVTDFIALFPKGDRRGNMGKKKLQQLFELLDIDPSMMPKKAKSKKDFAEILKALNKKTATIYVLHKESDGETRANVLYAEPASWGTDAPDSEEEADEEEEKEEEEEESDEDEDEDEEDAEEEEEEDDDDDEEEDEPPPAKKTAKKAAKPKK